MKNCLFYLIVLAATGTISAQEVMLTDSVIYIGKDPVAFYTKKSNNSVPHCDMSVFSLTKELLLSANTRIFEAPVKELKPFDYYEIVFPELKDTFALYYEGQAFPLTLAAIIRDYHLIKNNRLDTAAARKFESTYDVTSLNQKLDEITSYLTQTRHFDEQVVRDRTKPVQVINGRKIMQDHQLIGYVNPAIATKEFSVGVMVEVTLLSGRKIDPSEKRFFDIISESDLDKNLSAVNPAQRLYNISRNKKLSAGSDSQQWLLYLCKLITDYDL